LDVIIIEICDKLERKLTTGFSQVKKATVHPAASCEVSIKIKNLLIC